MNYTGHYFPEQMFVDYKADTAKPLPMFFQAGYLTIKGVDRRFNTYLLDYPNNEVKAGMITLLANDYLQSKMDTPSWVSQVVVALETGDLDLVRRLFTSFLAETPYSMRPKKDEKSRELADYLGQSEEQTKEELKQRYDGYHFSERMVDVYGKEPGGRCNELHGALLPRTDVRGLQG